MVNDTSTTPIRPRPINHYRTFLTCYGDKLIYGWHHVDLFVHDELGREVNWVHWTVEADGPEAADASLRREEPDLVVTTPWEHHESPFGMEYWTAEASWGE
jgi:hypothetical protein